MDIKRLLTGTIVGGIALFAVGFLEEQLIWPLAVANLAYAALITLGIGRSASVTVGAGATVGAVVGFLIWATADLTLYGLMNMSNLTLAVIDPLLEAVHGGIAGAVIALAIGKMK